MKISKVEAIPFKIPYKVPLKWGLSGYLDAAEHVLVRVQTDSGVVGVAEATPRPSIYGESLPSIVHAIRTWFAPMITGMDPTHTEKIWAKFDGIHWNPTAKGAIDLALYDAVARARGIPLWEMLGGNSDRLPVGWMLGMRSVPEMVQEALENQARGFKAFKVKVGVDPEKDVQVIKALRGNLGPEVLLYADANMAYSISTAIQTIKRMEEYGLAFVEEPIPAWNSNGRIKVAQAISIPIMGDESCFTPQDVAREISLGAIGLISIKTPRTGYTLSMKIVHLAEMAGIPCLMGSQAETGVGTLASAHFGAARRNVSYPSEISFFLSVQDDLLAEPILLKDGVIELPRRPGNGVVLDEEKIKKYRMD
ncbi:MAG: enolase [Deltaproteobacteria bacterium]|nr:enolase [Deltaproteobacteria bacterium]